MKKLVIAAGFLLAGTLAASSAPLLRGYVYGDPAYGYDNSGIGVYDYAPGVGVYDYAPGYGAYTYGGNWDYDRVDGPGRGNSAESQR
jgi:hypothetical protein